MAGTDGGKAPPTGTADAAAGVEVHDYEAVGVVAQPAFAADGPLAATFLHVAPGGALGDHVAGRDQVLLVVAGSGWLEVEGTRVALHAGGYGVVRAGQRHAKGSATGMVALVLQAPSIDLAGPADEP